MAIDTTTAFKAPVKQSFLPVISTYGVLKGLVGIATTTFTGSETTVTLDSKPVTISRYTLPQSMQSTGQYRVPQMMAIVIGQDTIGKEPWLGWSAFVPLSQFGDYRNTYSNLTVGDPVRESQGLYFWLMNDLAKTIPVASAGTAPSTTNATTYIAWAADVQGTDHVNVFFDFNWVQLFNATKGTATSDPISLTVVSNPSGVPLKAIMVGIGDFAPQNAAYYNTVRIMKTGSVAAGSYTFTFSVKDTVGNSTPVTLTLNVT